MKKVVKFGGSSVASANQIKKIKRIVQQDKDRNLVVVSACGKCCPEDNKITDLLYLCHAHLQYNVSCDPVFSLIKERFLSIKNELQLTWDIEKELDALKEELNKNTDLEYLVSRGEYFTARLISEYLDYQFIDAKELIFFHFDGSIDYPKIQESLKNLLQQYTNIIVPGFYGALPNQTIHIMSRGGGDVSGSILANALDADVYENWTDVSGILSADPRIVKQPEPIDIITYNELRELSYMGASVLHEEAIFPVKHKNIPIHILNTNDPDNKGTIIVDQINDQPVENKTITGIAGKKDFSIIHIRKIHMTNKVGTIRQALELMEEYKINVEHIPTGIDSFSLVVENASLKPVMYELLNRLKLVCEADELTFSDNIALIAIVSRFMKQRIGISGRLFSALGKEAINVSIISQTIDELSIVIGVHNEDYQKTIRTIYREFVE